MVKRMPLKSTDIFDLGQKNKFLDENPPGPSNCCSKINIKGESILFWATPQQSELLIAREGA